MSSADTAEEARIVVVADIIDKSRLVQRKSANTPFEQSCQYHILVFHCTKWSFSVSPQWLKARRRGVPLPLPYFDGQTSRLSM